MPRSECQAPLAVSTMPTPFAEPVGVKTSITNATQSTDETDGCLVLAGGIGVAKDIRCAGNSYALTHSATSDLRKKKNVVAVGDTSTDVENIRVVEYSWKLGSDDRRKVGVIAQEIDKIASAAVYESESGLSVDYNHIMCMMLKSHQQSLVTIRELTERLEKLEGK